MKKLLLLLLFTVPALANNGFKTENKKIVWEHIFPLTTDVKAIIESQDKLKLIVSDAASYTGKAEGVKNNADSSSVRLKCDANFDFTVTLLPEGYVVRVTNFVFLEKYGPSELRIIPNSLDKYYLEYGKIRQTPKTQGDLDFVDSFLTGVFSNMPVDDSQLVTYN